MAFLFWAVKAIAFSALSMYLIESALYHLDFSSLPESWDEALLNNLVLAGCYTLTYGIQSAMAGNPVGTINLIVVGVGCLAGAVLQYKLPIGGRDAA